MPPSNREIHVPAQARTVVVAPPATIVPYLDMTTGEWVYVSRAERELVAVFNGQIWVRPA